MKIGPLNRFYTSFAARNLIVNGELECIYIIIIFLFLLFPGCGKSRESVDSTPVYVSIISHNETEERYRRYDTLDGYLQHREALLRVCDLLSKYKATWDFQTDWRFLVAAQQFETEDITDNTDGLNILQYLQSKGVQIDPHSHEQNGYNYADIAYLIESLGVKSSGVVGGFLFDPPINPQNWERFRSPLRGSMFPDWTWQADILWGAATLQHQGQDDIASGIWRPKDIYNFYEADPAGIPYIGGADAINGIVGLRSILSDISRQQAPSGQIYTATPLIVELNFVENGQSEYDNLEAMLQELDVYAQNGQIVWASLNQIRDVWISQYNSSPNIYIPY